MMKEKIIILKSSFFILLSFTASMYGALQNPEDFQSYLRAGISAEGRLQNDEELDIDQRLTLINQGMYGGANFGELKIGDFQFFQGKYYTKTQEYLDALRYAEYKNKMRRDDGKKTINKLVYKLRYFCRKGNLLGVWVMLSSDQSKIFEISTDSKDTQDIDLLIDQNWSYYEALYGDLWKEYDGDDEYHASTGWYNRVLFTASRKNDLVIAYWCFKHGADINVSLASLANENKNTPTIEAAGWGSVIVLNFLIKCGANVNAKSTHSGRTALHAAARWGQLESAKILLDAGIKNSKDRAKLTAYALTKQKFRSLIRQNSAPSYRDYHNILEFLKQRNFE